MNDIKILTGFNGWCVQIYLVLVPGQNDIFLDNFLSIPLDLSPGPSAVVVDGSAEDVPLSRAVEAVVSGAFVGVLQQMAQIFVLASFENVQNSHSHSKFGVFGGGPSGSVLSDGFVSGFAIGATFGTSVDCGLGAVLTVVVWTSVDTFLAFPLVAFFKTLLFVAIFGGGFDFGFQKSLELSSIDDCCCAIFSLIFA